MASIPAPPVVDVNDYVAPKPSSEDVFLRRASWTKEQIQAAIPQSQPAPPAL